MQPVTPKINPFKLIWYRFDWSENQVAKNNTRYWKWEIHNNGFKPKLP